MVDSPIAYGENRKEHKTGSEQYQGQDPINVEQNGESDAGEYGLGQGPVKEFAEQLIHRVNVPVNSLYIISRSPSVHRLHIQMFEALVDVEPEISQHELSNVTAAII